MLNRSLINQSYRKLCAELVKGETKFAIVKAPLPNASDIGDLDILIADNEAQNFRAMLLGHGYRQVISEATERYKSMYRLFIEGAGFSSIHVHRRIAWDGVVVLSETEILQKRVSDPDWGFVPCELHNFLIHAAHALFEQPRFTQKLATQLNSISIDRALALETARQFGWKGDLSRLLEWLKNADPKENPLLQRMRRKCVVGAREGLGTLIDAMVGIWFRKFSELQKRKFNTVVVTGPDGVGKSLIAEQIVNCCQQNRLQRFRYQYLGFRELRTPFASLMRRFRKTRNNAGPKKGFETLKRRNSRLPVPFSVILAFSDYLIALAVLFLNKGFLGKNVICDRYFYDVVAMDPRIDLENAFVRGLLRVFPRPTGVFLLQAPAEVILGRKAEYEMADIEWLNERYEKICNLLGWQKIDATKSPSKILDELILTLWERGQAGLVWL